MKQEFEVSLQFVTYARVFVQADSQEQAEKLALSHETLSGLAVEAGEWQAIEIERI